MPGDVRLDRNIRNYATREAGKEACSQKATGEEARSTTNSYIGESETHYPRACPVSQHKK